MHFNCFIKGRGCEKEVERKKIRARRKYVFRFLCTWDNVGLCDNWVNQLEAVASANQIKKSESKT